MINKSKENGDADMKGDAVCIKLDFRAGLC